jgi:mycothiol synthase
MSSSLPDGLTLRPGRRDDVTPLTEMLVAEEVALRGHSEFGESDTEDWWRAVELLGESWIAESEDGRIAGMLGLVERGDAVHGWIAVHPDFWASHLDSALLGHAEVRACGRSSPVLRLDAFADHKSLTDLLTEAGYRLVRRYVRMAIELAGSPPAPEWPDRITCSTFDPADARAVYEALNEAFAEEWGFAPLPFEDWKEHRFGVPDFDPTLWFVARDGDEIAGMIRCDPKRWGGGWVGALAVRKPWRRRGLGLALLRQAFGEFHRRGERRVGLGVDTENVTGATRLYVRAGMSIASEEIAYEKELT